MIRKRQSHIIASLGTFLLMFLLFLLLWFLHLNYVTPVEDEGIVVTFGYAEEGGGRPDANQVKEEPQIKKVAARPAAIRPSSNDLMVQDKEETLALNKQTEEIKKKDEEDLLRQRREQEAREEEERLKREKAIAEKKAKEQQAIQNANKLAESMFGNSNSSAGANAQSGSASSDMRGNPVGKGYGESNGMQWTLYGRGVKALPKPSNDFTQEGEVVVQIWVDAAGNVTNATIHEGTTISDRHTQQLALSSARKAKFTEGKTPQIGTIKYKFKLN